MTKQEELTDANMTNVAAIKLKRTIAFVDHFVATNIQFLNSFTKKCDFALMAFERKLEKLEAATVLLEERFSSIPELNEITKDHLQQPELVNTQPDIKDQSSQEKPKTQNPDTTDTAVNNTTDSTVTDSVKEPEINLVQVPPDYERFMKMVQVGVPVEAVKLKVGLEGLDPNIFVKLLKK